MTTQTLATADSIVIPFAVVILIIQGLMGLALWAIKRSVSRVDELEKDVKAYAHRIIETKHAQVLDAIQRIEKRLESGDSRFSELNKHDHKAELQTLTKVEELHRYVTEHCATAEQQREFRKELTGLNLAVVRLQEAAA